jgi:hypothetical protein
MSAVTINEPRLKALTFTNAYMSPRLCFVVPLKMKKQFASVGNIQQNDQIEIAVLKGSAYESIARELFPHNKLLLLKSYTEFPVEGKSAALLWEEQEAIAWSLCHRDYRIVFPQPPIGRDTLAYAIRNGSPHFLHYLNQWLDLKRTQGYTTRQYELWVKGKTEIAAAQEPRWSIIRNVLHWVD